MYRPSPIFKSDSSSRVGLKLMTDKILSLKNIHSASPFQNKVDGKNDKERKPGFCCPFGGRYKVKKDHGHSVEKHRVNPRNLGSMFNLIYIQLVL